MIYSNICVCDIIKAEGPKMKIEDGKIILDQESLVLSRKAKPHEEYQVLTHEESEKAIKMGRKRRVSKRWSAGEEDTFYRVELGSS